jgi:hypothetical protein
MSGVNNTLTNFGTVTTRGAIAGTAVYATGGNIVLNSGADITQGSLGRISTDGGDYKANAPDEYTMSRGAYIHTSGGDVTINDPVSGNIATITSINTAVGATGAGGTCRS